MGIEKKIRDDFEDAGGFDSLIGNILSLSADVEPELHQGDDDEATIDCRLRWYEGRFYFYTGSSDYDQDHRGSWGCSCVTADMDKDEARDIAEELLEQVIEDAVLSLEN